MIYFDNNATTPILPEIREVIMEAMEKYWGNPSSSHCIGKTALEELENARKRIATLIDVDPAEIYFTSGGTESDNLALLGIMEYQQGKSLALSEIEHPAVKNSALYLKNRGIGSQIIPVNSNGIIEIDTLNRYIDETTMLLSIMAANNETGTIQPLEAIGEKVSERNIIFHTDAVQAFGKIPLSIKKCGISLMSISSHKIYGPKGCGAIYIKKGTPIKPRSFGGGQEKMMRTGTYNIPAILGFVKAAEIAYNTMASESRYLFELTELLYDKISTSIDSVVRNGDQEHRLPGTLNVSFPGTISGMVVKDLDENGICVSGGAACNSGIAEPSSVISALGRKKIEAISAIRFSLGRDAVKDDILHTVEILKTVVEKRRKQNS